MGKNQTSFKKGHRVPKEWIDKIVKALKGRKIPEERRRKLIGRKLSEKTKKKISKNSAPRGEKNWQWKGGVAKNKEYLSWIKNKRNRLKRLAEGNHTWEELTILSQLAREERIGFQIFNHYAEPIIQKNGKRLISALFYNK